MAQRRVVLLPNATENELTAALVARFEAVREQFGVVVPFPADVVAEAEVAAGTAELPDRDETALPFITIDPPGSMDLDQAMHLQRGENGGYRVRYAIADVPAFVRPGGAVDTEARTRGQTVYCPDVRAQLHPSELSEGAASLLPDQVRPAFVWDIALDEAGESTSATVYRAMVRSVHRYDYDEVQHLVDDGVADEVLLLLREIGQKRVEAERRRGGASLPMPEQVVSGDGDAGFSVSFRPVVDSEDWNAQISLLTGIAAAEMMIEGRVGILRTMPPPEKDAVRRFRRQATAAGVPWPEGQPYGEFLRTLDRTNPRHLALIHEATSLFRGATYTPFDGEVPEQREHAAVASVYAHVTAPLRRLVDRFGLVVCESLASGSPVPQWVRDALPTLPEIMASSDRVANGVGRACTDAVEVAELVGIVGRTVDGVVVDESEKGVSVQLTELGIVAKATGTADAGSTVRVRVDAADVAAGTATLTLV